MLPRSQQSKRTTPGDNVTLDLPLGSQNTPWADWPHALQERVTNALQATATHPNPVVEGTLFTIIHLLPPELTHPWLRQQPQRLRPFVERCANHLRSTNPKELPSFDQLDKLAGTCYPELIDAISESIAHQTAIDNFCRVAGERFYLHEKPTIKVALPAPDPQPLTIIQRLNALAKRAAQRKIEAGRREKPRIPSNRVGG